LSVCSVGAQAQQITIDAGRCDSGVRVVAKKAKLSHVLQALSQKLEFELQYESSSDPLIDIDLRRPAPELVARLAPGDNVMITQAIDPRCPRRYRISKVWVLPGASRGMAGIGQSAPGVTFVGKGLQPPAANPPPATPPAAQWTPARVDEMARQRKAAYDAYVKEHGKPPPPPPDDPAPN
jgi:hypothetical protein